MKSNFYTVSTSPKLLLILFFLALGLGLSAQATLSVQGVLTKSDGTAVEDGNNYKLTFRLWKSETSTASSDKVHEEIIDNISIVGGVYSVVLGVSSNPQYKLTAPFDTTYWLGVSVNTSTVELLPRPRLTHAPYALSIVGEHNVFSSTGPVKADAFRARGGQPIGGQGSDGNGFSFKPGADEGGGMFSREPNNIEFWAGGFHKAKLTSGLNELYGQTNMNNLSVDGAIKADNLGPLTTNGIVNINGGEGVNGNEWVSGNSTTNGHNTTIQKFLTSGEGTGGGYSFNFDNGFNTGMFGYGEGHFALKTDGANRIEIGSNMSIGNTPGTTYIQSGQDIDMACGLNGSGNFFMQNMKQRVTSGTWKNVQINLNNGVIQYDNSSRRFKRNIRPLEDDFSLILKAQPRVYNRLDNDTTYNELGYIAEEMDSIGLHKLVQHDPNGVIDGFDYTKMILYTVEMLKIQDAALKDLRTELEAIKAENNALKNVNQGLKTENGSLTQQQANFSAQLESLSKRMLSLELSTSGGSKK